MLVKIHKSYRDIVAICDSELIGKMFEEDRFQLDIKESFFKGDEKTHQEVIEIMIDMAKEDATFNIIGKESVESALEARIISKEGIKQIQGVPFALVLL
ncbi:MAG TPA: DUF424 family protein [Candidatus Nanoarchaeia archaeon]|nr:DUF424 family protein [Candidatus Nanoarchaeia archaeon]